MSAPTVANVRDRGSMSPWTPRHDSSLDADAFLRADQSKFGSAWRYELVRGTVIAHAAPGPEDEVILGNLALDSAIACGIIRMHIGSRQRRRPAVRAARYGAKFPMP